jgi:GT2 family glycosyltransferase
MIEPRVSFVVLTHNRRAELMRTLAQLGDLNPGVPTTVVDNASVDGTADAVAAKFPRVRLIRLARNVGAVARNVGVEASATPYVAFCDDDTWWRRGAAGVAADALDRYPSLAVVNARVLIGDDEREDPTCTRMEQTPFHHAPGVPGSRVFGFLAGACTMRRDAFLAAGGYHRRLFLGGEEDLLAIDLLAAGWQMAYMRDVVVHHHPSPVRNAGARRRLIARNALWCAWMRRPWPSALADTWKQLRRARRDGALVWTAASALAGLPWVLSERRVVSEFVESALRERERAGNPG